MRCPSKFWVLGLCVLLYGCSSDNTSSTGPTGDTLSTDTSDSSSVPQDTDTPPEDTDTPPEDTDTPPEDTNAPPEDTNTPPEDSNAPPEDTNAPPEDTTPPLEDTDNDGIADDADNCPNDPNTEQEDCDNDGTGDVCDEDSDGDGIDPTEDNCDCTANEDQADFDMDGQGDACDDDDDNDGVSDLQDAFPFDNTETLDSDQDGVGNNADDDDDNDGLLDEEENSFGDDCAITDWKVADTDGDGVDDGEDAYPNDPFPAFVTLENAKGTITVILSDGTGGFADPFEVGQPLGATCRAPESNCGGCGAGEYCAIGTCVTEDATLCNDACGADTVCYHHLYRHISIADFDSDGKMDFIANEWPPDGDGNYKVWFFRRLAAGAENFPQQYLGLAGRAITGTVADIDGDNRFDIVSYNVLKPNNISNVIGRVYLGNGIMDSTPCAAGAVDAGCAFTVVPQPFDIEDQVAGQWGFPRAREAQDLNGDTTNDVVFGTYSSGGNASTPVYLLPSNGDGTFGEPELLFTHNPSSQQAPANSMVFADFNNDEVGDVLVGFDDDGDPGASWLYLGESGGTVSSSSTKAIDLLPNINSGSEKAGFSNNAKAYDFNFDGNMDVILGYNYVEPWKPPSKLVVFFGNGDGTFGPETQIGPTWAGTEARRFQAPQRLCPWYVD